MCKCDHILGWDIEQYEGASPVMLSEMEPGGFYNNISPYRYLASENTTGFKPANFCSLCGVELDHSGYLAEVKV